MPGTFSPPSRINDPDMNHGTCVTHVPWCMPGWLTGSFLWSRGRRKRSRHSRHMPNPQFYVSSKRLVELCWCVYLSMRFIEWCNICITSNAFDCIKVRLLFVVFECVYTNRLLLMFAIPCYQKTWFIQIYEIEVACVFIFSFLSTHYQTYPRVHSFIPFYTC